MSSRWEAEALAVVDEHVTPHLVGPIEGHDCAVEIRKDIEPAIAALAEKAYNAGLERAREIAREARCCGDYGGCTCKRHISDAILAEREGIES